MLLRTVPAGLWEGGEGWAGVGGSRGNVGYASLAGVNERTRVPKGAYALGGFAPMLLCDLMLASAGKRDADKRVLNATVIIFRLQDYLHNPYIHRV